jgi:hypothetical protein
MLSSSLDCVVVYSTIPSIFSIFISCFLMLYNKVQIIKSFCWIELVFFKIFFALKSILFHNIATPAFINLLFTWYNSVCDKLSFHLSLSLTLKYFPRQHIIGCCVRIHFGHLRLLMRVFSPLILNVIIDFVEFRSTKLSFVFCSLCFVFLLSCHCSYFLNIC